MLADQRQAEAQLKSSVATSDLEASPPSVEDRSEILCTSVIVN